MILLHGPDIIVLTETWLHSNILNEELIPPEYVIVRKDRLTRGGGVAIALKNNISCLQLDEQGSAEMLWCKITIDNTSLLIGAVYRPPGSHLSFLEDLKSYMLSHVHTNDKIILAGDFNLPHIDWKCLSAGSPDRDSSECLLDIAFIFDLEQLVLSPTRIQGESESILDLTFVSHELSNSSEVSIEEGLSDHKSVLLTLPFKPALSI